MTPFEAPGLVAAHPATTNKTRGLHTRRNRCASFSINGGGRIGDKILD